MRKKQESYDLASVLSRLRKAKGASLSPDEISRVKKLVAKGAELEKEIEELQGQEDEAEAQRVKELAEIVFQRESQKARMEPQSEERTKAILAERTEIKNRLRQLGIKVVGN